MDIKQIELVTEYPNRLQCKPSDIQPHLADLLPDHLIKRVREEFYNPVVLRSALCILQAILAESSSDIPVEERIRYWFRDLEQIGAESVEGYAMRGDLGSVEDTFILKAPRDPEEADLIHELFIGLYGTNRLRPILANFAYIFGGFNCSLPIIQPRGITNKAPVISYCQEGAKEEVPYAIYENIAPAVSLKTYVETCTGEEFFVVLRQIYLALRRAWLTINFVHNDLHHDNVLVRELPRLYSFPYSGPKGIEFITTNRLATIIDFGRSHITYRGEHYGFTGLESSGVFEDLPLPIIDAYKILFFSLYSMMQSGNWDAFNQAKQLVPYFHPDLQLGDPSFDPKVFRLLRDARDEYFYYLSLTQQEQRDFHRMVNDPKGNYPEKWRRALNFDYDDLLLYMAKYCQCTAVTDTPVTEMAFCHKSTCGQLNETINSFFERPLNQEPTPEDFFELYDLETSKVLSPVDKDIIRTTFNYEDARDDYSIELLDLMNNLRDLMAKIDPNVSLLNLTPVEVNQLASSYHERFVQIANAVSLWREITFMVKIGTYTANLFGDTKLKKEIIDLLDQANIYHQRLATYITGLVQDRDYIEKLSFYKIRYNQELTWLRVVFPEALKVLQ